jgi:hypothetical protein
MHGNSDVSDVTGATHSCGSSYDIMIDASIIKSVFDGLLILAVEIIIFPLV